MQLPNVEQAEITTRKLLTYLLDHAHPQNKGKAAFYAIVGYNSSNTEQLKAALLKLVLASEVTNLVDTQFGKRYVVEGWLDCPNGKSYPLRTIWFISTGETIPKLVTAYPN